MANFSTYKPAVPSTNYPSLINGALDDLDSRFNTAALFGGTLGVTGAVTFSSTVNKVTVTAPAAAATLTLANNSSLITSGANSVTLTSTGVTAITLPTSGTLATLTDAALAGHLYGLTLSNNVVDATNDIDIMVGDASSNDALAANRVLMTLGTARVKQLDAAWAVGTNAGMRDTGAIANGTWHIFLIQRVDTAVVDVLASASATAPTMPANYTKARRIGSILREGAVIVQFNQVDDYFQRKTHATDADDTNAGASAVTKTLSVPLGIKVRAQVNIILSQASAAGYYALTDLDTTDVAPGAPGIAQIYGAVGVSAVAAIYVKTNTSAQIRTRLDASNAGTVTRICTVGWFDTRGRT